MPLSTTGSQAVKDGEAALQGGGGDVKGTAASQHCPVLRLLGGSLQREEVHCAGHRTHDIWHSKDVSVTSHDHSYEAQSCILQM